MTRRAAGEGSIHQRTDGRWAATVELGKGPDGRRQRRTVYGTSRKNVADKLNRLRRQADDGTLTVGPATTFGQWLDHWLDTIAAPTLRPRTVEAYRWGIERARPYVGHLPLAKVQAEHLDDLYARLMRPWEHGCAEPCGREARSCPGRHGGPGLSAASVNRVHTPLRRALRIAEKRRKIPRNPAALVTPPTEVRTEAPALTAEQAHRALDAAAGRRQPARWYVGLALGLRQGEALGLTWPMVDLEAGRLRVAWQLQRHAGRFALVEPKSRKSKRWLPLPPELVDVLREHRLRQLEERLALGERWTGWEHDLVFATVEGRPMHRKADGTEWAAILTAAGVDHVRVHDGRHTTATLLLEQGVDIKVVSEWLGHASIQLTQMVYQHVTERLNLDAAGRIGAALWPTLDSHVDSHAGGQRRSQTNTRQSRNRP